MDPGNHSNAILELRKDSEIHASVTMDQLLTALSDIQNTEKDLLKKRFSLKVEQESNRSMGATKENISPEALIIAARRPTLIFPSGIQLPDDEFEAPLLPPIPIEKEGKKCLVLDLDQTLIHSIPKSCETSAFGFDIGDWFVCIRPGVDEFLVRMGQLYEVVVFTAASKHYADAVLDKLDLEEVISHRLYRTNCIKMGDARYIKDLSKLGRNLSDVLVIDDTPFTYSRNRSNAISIYPWSQDQEDDDELARLIPLLEGLHDVHDVRDFLRS